jgi:hypothetical protein
MADDQGVVAVFVERSPGSVCDRAVVQTLAGFEFETRNQGIFLMVDELGIVVVGVWVAVEHL